MNLLILNGSPKGTRSNTLRLTNAFVERFMTRDPAMTVERLDLCSMELQPCRGCFACWKATPGTCVIRDDMAQILQKLLWADVIVYSFPLYYYGLPGALKNVIDRQLPLVLPFMEERTDGVSSGSHPTRYDLSSKRWVLISTCGFYSTEGNYDSVCSMFDHILGKSAYTTLFCGQGELFRVKELSERTDAYLSLVRRAGAEYADGAITAQTRSALSELLYPKEVFEAMADASWGISHETGEKEDESLIFTRQMAALYNKASYDGKDRVLEICYTDLGKTYQIQLGKDGSRVVTDGSLTATTRIDTPWDVWLRVSRGELRGDAALMQHLYRVSGDFSLMMDWDKYFGAATAKEPVSRSKDDKAKRPPTMLTMLAAWIALWVGASIDPTVGAAIALAVCACLPLFGLRVTLCFYDLVSIAAAGLLALLSVLTQNGQLAVTLGYLLFGLLWLVSCFTREPLCAAYVKYGYGGEDALQNPIFVKTNRILAAAWGILYLCIAVWTFLLSDRLPGIVLVLVNQSMPILMGVFTAWFQKWYPAHVAEGK